jgi:hypothetical protein
MLQSKLRQAIAGMEADSAQRLFGSVRDDIDFDEGVVGTDINSAFLTYAHVKHRRSILSRHFTSFSFAWPRAASSLRSVPYASFSAAIAYPSERRDSTALVVEWKSLIVGLID